MRFGIQTLVMIALSAPAFATETHCKGNEANLRMVEEMTEVLFNKRDEAQAPKYYAPEVISHNADRGGGETQRVPIANMQKMWRDSKANSPDRKLVNDLIICADDLVVVRVTLSANMTSPMGNIPANGKKYTTTATDTYRLKDGKVVERWGNNDQITILKQLGILEAYAKQEAAKP